MNYGKTGKQAPPSSRSPCLTFPGQVSLCPADSLLLAEYFLKVQPVTSMVSDCMCVHEHVCVHVLVCVSLS